MIISLKRNTVIQSMIVLFVFYLLYNHTIVKLINDWSADPNFSHGFLIPFVALYMIWYKRDRLSRIPVSPSGLGMAVIVLGMLAHIAGNLGAELFVQRVSILVTLSGIIMYFFGMNIFLALLVPVAYLLLMIPVPAIVWNKITFPLQLFAAARASEFIGLIGIPVLREGNILHLANTSLQVVDACSGLRSLTSLLALSGAFAYIVPLKTAKKWILFFSAVPIAVAVNVLRLTVTAGTAVWIGEETAHGMVHDMSGLIVFGAALVMVYLVFICMMKLENRRAG